ncbi:LysR substrate-binding domain-containing protein [Elioraea sp.]|jgi:LysR family glycine cleavage system transcriptional activator|uniref:LysR substrate-binding domain-containing protein n=1 Tax=Elioraea sp. TaxID=2185103 RepID=UPI003F71825A
MRRQLPPLTALRAFEAAARHLSFAAAAAELGVTPTAISHQIRELELACGQALFRRRPRPLVLTEAGQRLFPVLRAGLDDFAAAVAALREAEPRETLRLTTTNAFAHLWLVPRLAEWRKRRPDITLEIIGTDAQLDLRAGEADLAIRYARTAPPGLVTREILRDRHWPICSPSLLPGGTPARRPSELLRLTLIHMTWGAWLAEPPDWSHWLAAARRIEPGLASAGHAGALSFREELHAYEALLAGQGIAIYSDLLAARALASGRLVKAFDLSLLGLGFLLTHVPDHRKQAAIAAFSAWIEEAAAATPPERRGAAGAGNASAST